MLSEHQTIPNSRPHRASLRTAIPAATRKAPAAESLSQLFHLYLLVAADVYPADKSNVSHHRVAFQESSHGKGCFHEDSMIFILPASRNGPWRGNPAPDPRARPGFPR